MHAIQDSGTLELEAGDWKDERRVRLVAIDHGLMVVKMQYLEIPTFFLFFSLQKIILCRLKAL